MNKEEIGSESLAGHHWEGLGYFGHAKLREFLSDVWYNWVFGNNKVII